MRPYAYSMIKGGGGQNSDPTATADPHKAVCQYTGGSFSQTIPCDVIYKLDGQVAPLPHYKTFMGASRMLKSKF